MHEIAVPPLAPERFDALIGSARAAEFAGVLAGTRERLQGRTVWSVNSTAQGGGVAEMLSSVLCYLAGAGISTRWMVIDGNEEFFQLTKALHHLLHGDAGDDMSFGPGDRQIYDDTLAANAQDLLPMVRPGDPVILHDPQTVGLAPALAARGADVIWSCHVGADEANVHTRTAWGFLVGYLDHTRMQVFSRPQYAWEGLDETRVVVIPPCVDAFSPKNQSLDDAAAAGILAGAGLLDTGTAPSVVSFTRQDGSEGQVVHQAEVFEDVRLHPDMAVVSQISRWDPLKDHLGVMRAFTDHVAMDRRAHLMLAGPALDSVADDPEAGSTFHELLTAWERLPECQRSRVHIACLPMGDPDENAVMVNALQRRSDVIVQKSLAEGFGLTVAEAMWKAKPTVGSRVGGVQDQIVHGSSGLLIDNAADLPALGRAVTSLLDDRDRAEQLGLAAAQRVLDEYLAPCYLTRYLRLIDRVLG